MVSKKKKKNVQKDFSDMIFSHMSDWTVTKEKNIKCFFMTLMLQWLSGKQISFSFQISLFILQVWISPADDFQINNKQSSSALFVNQSLCFRKCYVELCISAGTNWNPPSHWLKTKQQFNDPGVAERASAALITFEARLTQDPTIVLDVDYFNLAPFINT